MSASNACWDMKAIATNKPEEDRMKISILMACLLLSACAPAGYQFSDPYDKKADFELTYKESVAGVSVNLDGYRQ